MINEPAAIHVPGKIGSVMAGADELRRRCSVHGRTFSPPRIGQAYGHVVTSLMHSTVTAASFRRCALISAHR
jgi:hypothetical protein